MKVLIVDDEPVICDLTKEILTLECAIPESRVFVASSGEQGYQIFKDENPDLVITDMMMPGMNGVELIQEIRKLSQETQIIIMTGYADLDMAVLAVKTGVTELIRKPFKPLEIVIAVKRVMEKFELKQQNSSYEQKLIESEKLSSLGLMAAGIAHEINNPNTFIKGNLELLQKYFDILKPHFERLVIDDEKEKRKVEMVNESFQDTLFSALNGSIRIAKIVSGLLSFSRQSPKSLMEIKLNDLVEESLILVTHRVKKHNVVRHFSEDDSAMVYVNPQKAVQILMNLLVNSCDAIEERHEKLDLHEKGTITIDVSSQHKPGYSTLIIKDDGIGMDDLTKKKIFDPFYTTKPVGKGTGLGMSIILNSIRENCGEIEFESVLGKGAKFTIHWPNKDTFEVITKP